MFSSFVGNSVKENIVLLLSKEWPLSIKEVHSRLKRQGVEVSYQAVHKALNELLNESVINKQGNSFQLSEEWIQSNKIFFEKIEKAYESKTITGLEKPIHLVFGNFQEFGKFLANEYYLKYPNPERKACVCIWKHTYPITGVSKKEVENMKKFLNYANHYGLSKNDTPLDVVFSNFLTKLGKKCFVGIKLPIQMDTFLQGDFICQAFFKEDYLKKWNKIYSKHKKLDDSALEELFAFISEKTEISVLIVKNSSFAEKLREDCERAIAKFGRKGKCSARLRS